MKSSTIIIFVVAIVCSFNIRQAAPDTVAVKISKMAVAVNKSITEIAEYYKNKSTDANTKLDELKSNNSKAIISVVNSGLKEVEAFHSSDQTNIVYCLEELGDMKRHMLDSLKIIFEKARDVISEQNPHESTIKAGNDLVKRLCSRNLLNRSKNGNVRPRQVIKGLKSKVKKFRKTVNSKKSAISKRCSDAISNAFNQTDECLKRLNAFVEGVKINVETCHLLIAHKRKGN